jgi:glyoxylase-like metal-dependent hydrolase (beta-lactamase superfamily II)
MTEAAPGIHRLDLPIELPDVTLAYVNAYLIKGDGGFTLIDSGWNTEKTLHVLQESLSEIGADIKDINQIVITHIHPDHYGMAGRLKEITGATLIFHDIEKDLIDSRYVNMEGLLEIMGRWLTAHGVPAAEMAEIRDATVGLESYVKPAYPDVTLYGGETITAGDYSFRVIRTPGHSSGHICLYEPDRKMLVSGDHILPTITPNIGAHPQAIDNTLGRYLQSLRELYQLDIELALPGHEKPFENPRERINELIKHHGERNREILAALEGKTATAYRIASEVTWGVDAAWHDLAFFHKRLAICETLAHLIMLDSLGQIENISRDGIIYYRQT